MARKHVAWYLKAQQGAEQFRHYFNSLEKPQDQLDAITAFSGDPDNHKELAA